MWEKGLRKKGEAKKLRGQRINHCYYLQIIESKDEQLSKYRQQIEVLTAENAQLKDRILQLETRLQEVEARLNQNSRNSSKPPSSDMFRPSPKSLRESSGRHPGGQVGHLGNTLKPVDKPNHIVQHRVECCMGCQHPLTDQEPDSWEKRQVFDIPPQQIEVTEHQAEIKICKKCGHENMGEFPPEVQQRVQYGNRIKSHSAYLCNYQFVPYERQEEYFHDVYGHGISQGTLVSMNQDCYEKLEETEAAIKEAIIRAPVSNHDETGISVVKEREWLQGAGTSTLTFYFVHPKRGKEAMDAMGILSQKGEDSRIIHDHLESYYQYKNCQHGLCNAHHLRELKFVEEEYKQPWAGKMKELLITIKNAVSSCKEAGGTQLSKPQVQQFKQDYAQIIQEGLEANLTPNVSKAVPKKRGRKKQSKPKNLLDRLDKDRKDVLAFMGDFRVPFDNNQAERDLRMIKAKQKGSGCFRSRDGAKAFCRIRGYISTARKNGVPILQALQRAFAGNPFVPAPVAAGFM